MAALKNKRVQGSGQFFKTACYKCKSSPSNSQEDQKTSQKVFMTEQGT